MTVYSIEKLIEETRRVAAEYRRATGKSLPVTPEIARFDAISLLGLDERSDPEAGIDAVAVIEGDEVRYQIKGRVMFGDQRGGQRIGHINPDGDWDRVLLVLLDEDYRSTEIYELTRGELVESGTDVQQRRGAMTVARFKAVGRRIWASGVNAEAG